MYKLALATDTISLPIDYDMPLLLDACQASGFITTICAWEDISINWADFDAVLIRSTWNCIERLPDYLAWYKYAASVTRLYNPLPVANWILDKHYLADLSTLGVSVVPSMFIGPKTNPLMALEEFFSIHPDSESIVIKPTIGSYSKGVQRYTQVQKNTASAHIAKLFELGHEVILQPYLDTVDHQGETNLVYFDNTYSHAICKSALLMSDGTVNAPTLDYRKPREAEQDEKSVALTTLKAAASYLGLDSPLLYGRVDLIRDNQGKPMVLELDICEPSLNLSFQKDSALRLVSALKSRINADSKVN